MTLHLLGVKSYIVDYNSCVPGTLGIEYLPHLMLLYLCFWSPLFSEIIILTDLNFPNKENNDNNDTIHRLVNNKNCIILSLY